jgi:hypothetical protein
MRTKNLLPSSPEYRASHRNRQAPRLPSRASLPLQLSSVLHTPNSSLSLIQHPRAIYQYKAIDKRIPHEQVCLSFQILHNINPKFPESSALETRTGLSLSIGAKFGGKRILVFAGGRTGTPAETTITPPSQSG